MFEPSRARISPNGWVRSTPGELRRYFVFIDRAARRMARGERESGPATLKRRLRGRRGIGQKRP